MSFFTTSTGENAASNATGAFEMGGGDFAPIPKNTRVLAMCDEAKISEYEGDRYINLKWAIAAPAEYKGRVVFQKVRCWEQDSAKRDKALRMLAAIDANAGGKLAASGAEPTDLSLQTSLTAKPMVLLLGVWEIKEDRQKNPLPQSEWKSGNFVTAVSKHEAKAAAAPKAAPKPAPAPVAQSTAIDDSDIPFRDFLAYRGMHTAM